jgi:hypothetical protein
MEEDARTIFITHFGYNPFSPDAKTTLSIEVRRIPGKRRVDLSTRDEAGNITWSDFYEGNVHCWGVIHSAAFMAKMNFVPPPSPPVCPACPAPAPPAPCPGATQAPAAAAQRRKEPPCAAPPRPQPSWWQALQFELSAGISGGYGVPPGASVGPVLGFGARLPALSFGVELDARFALSAELDHGAVVSTSTVMGEAFACLHRRWFFGCGLLGFGHLIAEPDTTIGKRDAEPNFLAAGLRLGTQWPLAGRFALRTYVDGFFSTTFGIEFFPDQLVWTSPPGFVTFGIAGVVTF